MDNNEDLRILLQKSYECHGVLLDHKDCKDILDWIEELEEQNEKLKRDVLDMQVADDCDGVIDDE